MAGLGRGDRGLDRLVVAHLADQDDVGVLAQGGAQGGGEGARVDLDLALVDDRLLVAVQELDGVLDGDDVLAALRVDVVDHRGEGGGLARAGGPRAQDQPALLLGDLLEHHREAQLADGHDLDGDDAEHEAHRAALLEDVAAEAAEAGDGVGDVDLEVLLELLLLAVAHDGERHGDGVLLHEALGLHQRDELAVDAQDGVRPDLQVEVGGLALRRHLQEIVDVHAALPPRGPLRSPTPPPATPDTKVSQPCVVRVPALDHVEESLLQRRGDGAALPGAHRVAVDRADGGDLGRGAGEEELVGEVEHLARERLLLDRDAEPAAPG